MRASAKEFVVAWALVVVLLLFALPCESSLPETWPEGKCAESNGLELLQQRVIRVAAIAKHGKDHMASIGKHMRLIKRSMKRISPPSGWSGVEMDSAYKRKYIPSPLPPPPPPRDDCDDYMHHFAQAVCAARNYLSLPDNRPCSPEDAEKSKEVVFDGKNQTFIYPVTKPGNCNVTGGMWWEFGRRDPEYTNMLAQLDEITNATCKYDDNNAALWNYANPTWPGNDADIVPPFCTPERWNNWWTVWSQSFTAVNTETLYNDFYDQETWTKPNTALINVCKQADPGCLPDGEGAQEPLESSFFYAVEVPEMVNWAKRKRVSNPPLKLYSISDNCQDVLDVFTNDYPDWVTGQSDGVTCEYCPNGWVKCVLADPKAYANCGDKAGFPPVHC